MDIQSGTNILLTGAGFTHNFGTPLAEGMWNAIFNHQRVQSAPPVRKLLLDQMDFEAAYHEVMKGPYSDTEKEAIDEAVRSAYDSLDAIVRDYVFQSESDVNIYGVQALIAQFGQQPARSFVFTLNQDLFVERHHYNGKTPAILGLSVSDKWFSPHNRGPIGPSDYQRLPTQAELEANKQAYLSRDTFYYVKLHGSQNWQSATGARMMVIGRGKAAQIQDEPLLAWYAEVFRGVLTQPDRRLLVIGYGFGGEHINEIIAEAIRDAGLRLYVLSPSPAGKLKADLQQRTHGQTLWEGLSGYFAHSLWQVFPGNQKVTEARRHFERCFFG